MRIRIRPPILLPILLAALVATLLMPAAPAQAPSLPPNDDREDALPIPLDGFAVAQPTMGAGLQPSEAAPCETIGATVWYVYQPLASGNMRVNTHGSTFDTVLTVYILTPFGLVPVGCSDDAAGSPNGFTSEVRFRAITGATYYFQAGGYAGSAGTLALRLLPAAVPVGR